MNGLDLNQRLAQLQQQNQRLRQTVNSSRNSQGLRKSVVDFQTKYKKALKQIYEVIQANKQLKQQLDKLKTSRHMHDSSMSDIRKEEIYRVYEGVLREKNELASINHNLQMQKQRFHIQVESLEAQMNILNNEKLYLAQQNQALQNKKSQQGIGQSKAQQLQQFQIKYKQKENQYHRTIQNYEQHHSNMSKQNKKSQERVIQLQQKVIINEKNWRNRLEAKEIQMKDIKSSVRHEYQEQINNLRKQSNALKLLNTELMTKLQTVQIDHHQKSEVTQYEIQMLNSIKELRIQMEPLKKQIIELQQINNFEKEQSEREKTTLQMKVYELQGDVERYSILIKNQQDKIVNFNAKAKKHQDNEQIIKKLEQQNKILGGRVIVLESKDVAIQNRKEGSSRLQQKVLQFQTRVQLLLNQKQNISNIKNVSIHQLLTLKSYIIQLDQKLKIAGQQNDYATRKYKSYKEKYMNTIKEMKNHQLLQNTLKSKIMGYDKLVQRLQSELEKNVNINEMEIISFNTKVTTEHTQIQTFKKKYQGLKEKLILQQKYNKQELQTVKLNYQTKIVDLSIKAQQINGSRQTISLYKQKNQELISQLSQKQNQILQIRLSIGRQSSVKNEYDITYQNQNRQIISTLQQTIRKQQGSINKIQTQAVMQEDFSRNRIVALEKELQNTYSQFNKVKLSSSSRNNSQKSAQQLTYENKRLKNRISELQNQLIMIRGVSEGQSGRNSYELQFNISSLQIQKSELTNKLQTQISYRKRFQRQIQELTVKNNDLDTQLTQVNMQSNRKIQQIKYELDDKLSIIDGLEQEIKRLKSQQRSNIQSSTVFNSSSVYVKENHLMCQSKIQRLEGQLQSLQSDNQVLRNKVNQSAYNGNSSLNYELESIREERDEIKTKMQRLQKELSNAKNTINGLQQEQYTFNRNISALKSQLSSQKLRSQDEIFQKDRAISQLRGKIQQGQSSKSSILTMQSQFEHSISQKDRQIQILRSKVVSYDRQIHQLNNKINNDYQQIMQLRRANESSISSYHEQIQAVIQEKEKAMYTLRGQISSMTFELNQKSQELSLRNDSFNRIQRQLNEYKEYEQQVERLRKSLNDRQVVISKNKFQMTSFEDQNQRVKKQVSFLKQQLQKLKYLMIQKQDQISSLRLQLSNLQIRLTNQIKNEYIQQINQRQTQISRLGFQIQSQQNNFNSLQQELNQLQSRQRKAQNDAMFLRNQVARLDQQLTQTNQKLNRKEMQFTQVNSEVTSLKFLEKEINEKNAVINRLKTEISEIRVSNTHLNEEMEYKESTMNRQQNDIKLVRQQLIQKEDYINSKQVQLRSLNTQVMRLRSTIQQTQIFNGQKDMNISRVTGQLNKIKNQHRDLQEQVQQRQQQWSNINNQLAQAKSQMFLIADQIEGKDITITKLFNESAFLKQQITRLNQQLVQKNHQVNRINQQVFIQKMEYTNQTNQQVQSLSNESFSLKKQLELTKHSIEDLESQNRRLRIELDGSRLKLNQMNTQYIYTEEDFLGMRQQNNKIYRDIMEMQLQLNQRTGQIELTNQRASKTQKLLEQVQEQHTYNIERMEQQIQGFINNQRQLKSEIQQLGSEIQQSRSIGYTANNTQNQDKQAEELKFGLHLYTEETERLQNIISQLNEQVSGLKLKLTAYVNQEDRIQQNLVTMVMTFSQIQSLRERMKSKETEINEVRKSLILVASSNDINSQYLLQSSKIFVSGFQNRQKAMAFEDVLSQNSGSIAHFKNQNNQHKEQAINQMNQFEIKNHNNLFQYNFAKDVVESQSQLKRNDSAQIFELNKLKQTQKQEQISQSHVKFVMNAQIQNQTQQMSNPAQIPAHIPAHIPAQIPVPVSQINSSQQRGRGINITYQDSHIHTSVVQSVSQQRAYQRITQSQYQVSPSSGYIRVLPRGIPMQQNRPPITVSQGTTQANPRSNIQTSQQSGHRITINNQTIQGRSATSSFPSNPRNMGY